MSQGQYHFLLADFFTFNLFNFFTMKKLYVLTIALVIGASAQAQTVDFESFTLAADTFDNGSAGNGDFLFLSNEVSFTNVYDTQWSSWSGFAISNMTDVTTDGWGNQYSVYTGSGYDGSSNYAVYFDWGVNSIETTGSNNAIDSFFITNTTYSALSMLNGDGWGKQFGSIYNGDSTVIDGTNGEDFYRIWVYGNNDAGDVVDSVEIYLADYRFADNNLDYIVDDWIKVDLTGFGAPITKVHFKIESSDTTGGFINTPTYFAVDNVHITIGAGVSENQLTDVSVYPNPATDRLVIKGERGTVSITSLTGEQLFTGEHNQFTQLDLSDYSSGIYVIQLVNASSSYTNRFVKQ